MRLITKTMVALAFVGATALGASTPAPAQGVYFSGPGVEFGVGAPRYRYYRHYGYDPYWSYGRSYNYSRPYWRHHRWHRSHW